MKKKPVKPNREIQHEAARIAAASCRPLATQWYVAAGELAQRLGLKAGGVLEMFAEMAHVYAYDAPREDAERRAWNDTVSILEAQVASQERRAS